MDIRERLSKRHAGLLPATSCHCERSEAIPMYRHEIASARRAGLAMTMSPSHRDVRVALADFRGVERRLGEGAVLGQDEGRRAHALRRLLETGRANALPDRLRGFAQAQPRHDDGV